MKTDKYLEERDNINAWFNRPQYRKWKYTIIGVASIIVLIMVSMLIWMDSLTQQIIMIMRGCAGALGILFVILCAIYCYIVYRDYIRDRFGPHKQ